MTEASSEKEIALKNPTVSLLPLYLISGSVAGAIGKFTEYPFDTIKVKLQSQPLEPSQRLYSGPLDCFLKTIRTEGFFSLYRGLPSPLICSVLENAGLFFTYGYVQTKLSAILPDNPLTVSAISGFVGGCAISFLLTPAELIKCRLQVSASDRYKNSWDCFRQIIRDEGVMVSFRGFFGTLLRESMGCGAWFATYDSVILKLIEYYPDVNKKHELRDYHLLFAGSCSGLAYNIIMFPADVVKSRMQALMDSKSSGFLSILKQVYKHEGFSGLYRGCGITLFRSIPTSALMFYTYECTLKYLLQE